MKNFFVTHWADVRFGKRYYGNGLAIASNKFHFKGFPIRIAVNNCPYITTLQAVYF